MKIQVLSDLHVEISDFRFQDAGADVIVLAGDIGKGLLGIQYAQRLLKQTDAEILIINGNHEFYGQDYSSFLSDLRVYAAKIGNPRLHFMEGDQVIIKGTRFLGCTLWTDMELFGDRKRLECKHEARYMNDFRLIRKDHSLRKFSVQDSVDIHRQSRSWLEIMLDKLFDGPTVVVTHHLPSFESVATEYSTDLLSACFASRLDHMFGKCDLWIHGHTHTNFDYVKDGTRVVCNPRGYSRYEQDIENYGFDPKLVIEIPFKPEHQDEPEEPVSNDRKYGK